MNDSKPTFTRSEPYDELLKYTIEALAYANELDYRTPESDLTVPDLELQIFDDLHLERKLNICLTNAQGKFNGVLEAEDSDDLDESNPTYRRALEMKAVIDKLERQQDSKILKDGGSTLYEVL